MATAGLLFTVAMLTHQLPVRSRPGLSLLPADWKTYFRIGTGVVATNQINKAFDWQPPPWLGAIEAVTLINPLAMGVSGRSIAQWAVMTPLVAGVVQLANGIQNKISDPLKENFNVPHLITRLAISLVFGVLGIKFYPKLFEAIAKSGIFGKTLKEEAASGALALAGSAMMTCARGCSPGSIICLSETAEMLGSLGNWFKDHFQPTTPTPSPSHASQTP